MPRISNLTEKALTGAQFVVNAAGDEAGYVPADELATAAQGALADSAVQPGDTTAATSKTTPVDTDEMPIQDSAASFGLKKLTWANLKAALKTYLDTLYQPVDADLTAISGLSPSNDDVIQRKAGSWVNRTMAQVLSDLAAFVGDSGSGGTKGLVPAPSAGDAAALKFLKADGTWAVPAGGGSGDVVGPASSVNNRIAVFSGTTGKLLADGGTLISGLQSSDATLTALAAYNTNGIVTQTAADTFTGRTITGGTDVAVSNGNGVSGNPTLSLNAVAQPYGKQAVPIPASAMKATTTNGAASGTVEMATNKNLVVTLDFDASTQEFAQFSIPMPKSWNENTITFIPHWSHASTATNFGVVWQLQAVAVSNDDALDVAFGTAQTSTDTGGTTNDYYAGPESSAITIAGTPAANDLVMFQVARVPANGSDTMAIDARLHGITLFITTDAGNDV